MTLISIYNRANDVQSKETISLDLFLDGIKSGQWQDQVLKVRTVGDKALRDELKKKANAVTISGTFFKREDSQIDKHSGFIGIDIDNLEDNVPKVRKLLEADKYVYALFRSISAKGLCALFKIKPTKHRESFQGISEYLYRNYGIIIDPTSINQSRARFVSYDPELYTNTFAEKFEQYPKSKPPRKIDKVVYIHEDFKHILEQISSQRINICEDYHQWLRIGFSLVHQFGEAGRDHFHLVSQYSSKYDSDGCDKQYDVLLKHSSTNIVTIATFYYYCKEAGITIHSETSKKIIQSAKQGKNAGLAPKQIADNLKKFEGIDVEPDLIEKVNLSNTVAPDQLEIVAQIEMFIRTNYNLRRNSITRMIENEGQQLEDRQINSMFINLLKAVPKAPFQIFDKLIQSDFIPTYNPFLDFIAQKNQEFAGATSPVGLISKVARSIDTIDKDYAEFFFTKWMVAMIASIHGYHSPLMPILSGEVHGKGKTEFFRRLLPNELKKYVGEVSPGIKDNDFHILMTQCLIILDDECGGKSKKDEMLQKSMLSKQYFNLREPYGRSNVTLQRIAMMCGTTNQSDILNDPTGNRRFIPIKFNSYDFNAYNSVDKTEMFMEAYNLYKQNYSYELTSDDIKYLNKYEEEFERIDSAKELIQKYYIPCEKGTGTPMTTTDIKVEIEDKSKQKLSLTRIGLELKKLGFEQDFIKPNGKSRRVYYVKETGIAGDSAANNFNISEDLPY